MVHTPRFIKFSLLTEAQALEYLDYVRRRREIDLGDLYQLLSATGGPALELDGSVASLDALWAWSVSQADTGFSAVPDGIPLGRTPTISTGDTGEDLASLMTRREYVSQLIEAYVEVVCRVYDPASTLAMYNETRGKRVIDSRLGRTGVLLSTGQWVDLDVFVPTVYHRIHSELRATAREPGHLFFQLRKRSPEVFARPTPARLSPVLAPFVDSEWVDFADPRRVPPVFTYVGVEFPDPLRPRRVPHAPQHDASQASEVHLGEKVLFLASGPAEGFEKMRLLADIDPDAAAQTLINCGFEPHASGDDLRSRTNELWLSDLVRATNYSLKGKLKYLAFERVNADDEQWLSLAAQLEQFAATFGGRLGAHGSWPSKSTRPS